MTKPLAASRQRRATEPDPLTPEQRKLNMSRIRARDTKPEMTLRRALHATGVRYRLHDRGLPGTPDLVMRSRRAVVFVHGCFWHAHDCPYGVTPATNEEFWREKLARNAKRDAERIAALHTAGWRVAVVWECALSGRARRPIAKVVAELRTWLECSADEIQIEGRWEHKRVWPG